LSALTIFGLFAVIWLDSLLRQAGRPKIDYLDASGVPLLLAAVSAATVGGCWLPAGPATRWAGCCSAWGYR
jgi:hypothetical protein